MSLAYYNEYDKHAAAWLRELIKQGHIAPGDVDERSIEDVFPNDLIGYTQCHFFAGLGGWSYALRKSGWPDDRPVWTGSCPCQPFSAAGKGTAFDDERHLWPALHHLIRECKPNTVFGEQVASKDGLAWLDLVHTDMEAEGYAFGAVDLCAAGVGAPHIRQRLWWVADANDAERRAKATRRNDSNGKDSRREKSSGDTKGCGRVIGVVDALVGSFGSLDGQPGSCGEQQVTAGGSNFPVGLADAELRGRECVAEQHATGILGALDGAGELRESIGALGAALGSAPAAGPTNGLWRDADWLFCRDGKWRPVEPGTFPLVNGASARVVRLRGYGNAINSEAAKEVISAYMRNDV